MLVLVLVLVGADADGDTEMNPHAAEVCSVGRLARS